MGKISGKVVEEIALKIVEPIKKKMKEIEDQIQIKVYDIYVEKVPEAVMKIFKTNSEYIKTVTTIYLKDHGFNNRTVNIKPCPTSSSYSDSIHLTAAQAKDLQKLEEQKEKLKDKYNVTKKEVEGAILALGTHKRVIEQFPEIAPFLDIPQANTVVMLMIEPLRKKVQCLISEDKEKKCIDKI